MTVTNTLNPTPILSGSLYIGPTGGQLTSVNGWTNVGYTTAGVDISYGKTRKKRRPYRRLVCDYAGREEIVKFTPGNGNGVWRIQANGVLLGVVGYNKVDEAWTAKLRNQLSVPGFKTRRHAAVHILESLKMDWELV